MAVVEAMETYDTFITKPDMTSQLEKDMDYITTGKFSKDEVVDKSKEMLREAFSSLKKNREKIRESLKNGLYEDSIMGTCPECEKNLVVKRSRKGGRFVGCEGYPDCTFTFPVPRKGAIVVSDKPCTEHEVYEITIINKGRRPWKLGCPYCNFLKWKEEQEQAKKKEE